MSRFLIHACHQRKWYVYEYLIPSMLQQGIKRKDIVTYLDCEGNGNLESFLMSIDFLSLKGNTWHLQDDVIIASNFYESVKYFDSANKTGIICGFCSKYDDFKGGTQPAANMWYSFPCIRIDNAYARGFKKWVNSNRDNPKYEAFIAHNKYDDCLFKAFMGEKHSREYVINAIPNLVDHIDYLLGGSVLHDRKEIIRSKCFDDTLLVDLLEKKLKGESR